MIDLFFWFGWVRLIKRDQRVSWVRFLVLGRSNGGSQPTVHCLSSDKSLVKKSLNSQQNWTSGNGVLRGEKSDDENSATD